MDRYIKNIDSIFTLDLQELLLSKKIAVIGCGGQGGYILEFLTRLGVHSIYFWDGDNFNLTNINRQYGCLENTIGLNKAQVMKNKLTEINSSINLIEHNWYFGEKNEDIIEALSCDMLILAADNSYNVGQTREMIKLIIQSGVPCIDEWIRGLGGEISIITNKNLELFDTITTIWEEQDNIPEEERTAFLSQTAFRCAAIAAETINQLVQYFSENSCASLNSTLYIDLYHHKYQKYDKYGTI